MVNLKDIAAALGVNISTVSRALNDSPEISEATKELVREKAKELNYRPNLVARTLTGKSTKTIGLIVPEVKSDYYAQITNHIEAELRKFGYSIIIGITDFSQNIETECLLTLGARKVDGIIYCNTTTSSIEPTLKLLEKDYKLPIVLIDPLYPISGFDVIMIDNTPGIHDAAALLARTGRTRVAFISDEIARITRFSSFTGALKANGLPYYESLTAVGDERFERGGYLRMKQLLEHRDLLPDAVFAAYDDMAIGVMKALYEAHITVPEQIAVIGYDNIRYTEFLYQPLTTIDSPLDELSRTTVKFLIDRIHRKSSASLAPRFTSLPTTLIRRETA